MQKLQFVLAFIFSFYAAETFADTLCPDQQSKCPTGTTCCKLQSGSYGCCPMEHAVCCSDGIHCCPEGYQCDVKGGRCTKSPLSNSNTFEAYPIQSNELNNTYLPMKSDSNVNYVLCPGGLYQCPDGSTCCPRPAGQWSCCPMIHAVCCSDYIHCCPYGTYCDVVHAACYHSNGIGESIPWSEKFEAMQGNEELPAQLLVQSEKHVDEETTTELIPTESSHHSNFIGNAETCKDGSKCSEDNTCCENADGKYNCCPFSHAVCCQEHCCPQGSTCDRDGNCLVDGISNPWQVKTMPAVEDAPVICPDKHGVCPSNTTCCRETTGVWGCCPYPDAVCCADGEHCCPSGFVCDSAASKCVKQLTSLPQSLKKPLWTGY